MDNLKNKKILALFPGQGSQKLAMGKDLYDNFDIAKDFFQIADKTLGFKLSEICFSGSMEELTKTENVQPAILTVSTICFEIYKEKFGIENIIVGAGHSLGEYSALVAAKAISFSQAVLLVHKRGKYMQEAVPAGKGKMLAVIGKDLDILEKEIVEFDQLDIANINSPGQIVISGSAESIDIYLEKYKDTARLIELSVSAPFHSSLMKPAAEKLAVDLEKVEYSNSIFPIISNVTAKSNQSLDEIKNNLKNQVCGRVRWVETINEAISNYQIDQCIEFGSGNVLSGLMKRIDKSIEKSNFGKLEDF